MTDRITRAEEQLAHLAHSVEELSEILTAQQAVIDRLERRLALLQEREAEREWQEGGTLPISGEPPPHY